MVRITGNFTGQSPLHPAATAILADVFGQGWADPAKIGDNSARTAILRNEAIASLAKNLSVAPNEIEIIGEPRLGQHLAISGLLTPSRRLIHSEVDRKSIFAVAADHAIRSGSVDLLKVDSSGQILADSESADQSNAETVLAIQGANIETGVRQNLERVIGILEPTYIALDFSAAPNIQLPTRWDSAIFDATSWQGPAGIGILVIRNSQAWKNPLPNLGLRRTPESSSLPLLLASAVALDAWLQEEQSEQLRIGNLNQKIRHELQNSDLGITFAGDYQNTISQTIAMNASGCIGEDLVRQLNELNLVLDSGSACTSTQMQPSHVLKALGMESSGNLRITLHHGVTEIEVAELIKAITSIVQRSR